MKVPSPGSSGGLVALGLLTLGAMPALAADASAAPPAPICAHGEPPSWVTEASHPNDGVPDPAGRIVFGRWTRDDDFMGQIVSLYAVDPDGSDLVQLLDCDVARPRFSPDGSRLAFSIAMEDGSEQVATMAPHGSDLRILSTAGYAGGPDWSPDGSWLVYSHAPKASCPQLACALDEGFHASLWRMDADGSDQRHIGDPDRLDGDALGPPTITQDGEARLSPDGTEVVFNQIDGPDFWYTLMIRDLATGEERQVTANDRQPEHPEWSPDGGWIIYNTLHPARGSDELFEQIERVPADDPTAEPEVLYPSGGGRLGWKPTYSPDGSSIAFFCEGKLCRMDADGSNVVVLAEVPDVELNHVAWGVVPTEDN